MQNIPTEINKNSCELQLWITTTYVSCTAYGSFNLSIMHLDKKTTHLNDDLFELEGMPNLGCYPIRTPETLFMYRYNQLPVPAKEKLIKENIDNALLRLQQTHLYHRSGITENDMNDCIRNILSGNYEVYDQTRKGRSASGIDSGELDIELRISGKPVAIYEGQILESVNKANISEHVTKAMLNYNPHGLPYIFHAVYYRTEDSAAKTYTSEERFFDFWRRYLKYLSSVYEIPLVPQKYENGEYLFEINEGYSNLKHAYMKVNMEGTLISVHFYAVKMEIYRVP